METPLTLEQTIGIATGSWTTPMRASSLRKMYGTAGKPLSLLSIRDKLRERKNIVILQVRNSSILGDSPTLAALQANWASLDKKYVPTQQALANFVKVLHTSGVSVVKISKDWRTVALSGTTSAFASIPTAYFYVKPGEKVSIQSSAGLKILGGGDAQAAAGAGLVAGGSVAAGGGALGASGTATITLFGAGSTAAGSTGGVGFTFLGGASADAAVGGAAASGPIGWGLLALGAAAIALGAYLWGTADSPSTTSSGTSNSSGPTSQNDTSQSYQAGDGTEVYGATSATDATAIANALNGLSPVPASAIPSDPPASPICPATICPSVPICAAAVATNQGGPGGPGPGDPSGCPNNPFGICPSTGLPVCPSTLFGPGGGLVCPGEEEG